MNVSQVSVAPQGGPRSCSILHICYLGVNEPLVQTQVIPYLAGLSGAGHGVALLTFEPTTLPAEERRSIRETLRSRDIAWHHLRYHKQPALPATFVDVVTGILFSAYLIRRRHIDVVHARGDVPAAMAVVLKRLFGTRVVFDLRGLMADEYADAGMWRRDGILYRLTKRMEALFLANADAVVVLTKRARRWLTESGLLKDREPLVEVIPCCVDLDRFSIAPQPPGDFRRNIECDGHAVMVYVGKLGGWYMSREMADFFAVVRRHLPGLRFLVLTQSDGALLEEELARRGIDRNSYQCLRAAPDDIPRYLSRADFAIALISPCFSKLASSPTKIAEYLAAGLPVVYNAGIGDLDELEPERVGVIVKGFEHSDYEWAAEQMRRLLVERRATAARCRKVAEQRFSLTTVGIARYLRLYSTLTRARNGDCQFSPTSDAAAARSAVVGGPGRLGKG